MVVDEGSTSPALEKDQLAASPERAVRPEDCEGLCALANFPIALTVGFWWFAFCIPGKRPCGPGHTLIGSDIGIARVPGCTLPVLTQAFANPGIREHRALRSGARVFTLGLHRCRAVAGPPRDGRPDRGQAYGIPGWTRSCAVRRLPAPYPRGSIARNGRSIRRAQPAAFVALHPVATEMSDLLDRCLAIAGTQI